MDRSSDVIQCSLIHFGGDISVGLHQLRSMSIKGLNFQITNPVKASTN